MRNPQLALEYLVTCSQTSLEGFELARLSQISSFRKQFGELQDQWIEAEVAARLARLLLEHRRAESQSPFDSPALLANISVLERLSDEPVGSSTLQATTEFHAPPANPRESLLRHPDLRAVETSDETEARATCRARESLMLCSAPSNYADVSPASRTDRPARRSRTGVKPVSTLPAAFASVSPRGGRSHLPAKALSSNLLLFVAAGSPASTCGSRQHGHTKSQQLSLFVNGSEKFQVSRPFESRKSRRRPICSESSVSQVGRQRSGCSAPRPISRSTRRSMPHPALRPIHRKALGQSRRPASSA